MKKLIKILKKSVMYFMLIVVSLIVIGFAIKHYLGNKQLNLLKDIIKKSDYITFDYHYNPGRSLDMNSLPLEKKKEILLDLVDASSKTLLGSGDMIGQVYFYIKRNYVGYMGLGNYDIKIGYFTFYGEAYKDAKFDYILRKTCAHAYFY